MKENKNKQGEYIFLGCTLIGMGIGFVSIYVHWNWGWVFRKSSVSFKKLKWLDYRCFMLCYYTAKTLGNRV